LDEIERQNAALTGPRNLKTTVIGKDGGPYNVRQIRIGAIVDREGLPCKIVCPKQEGIYVKKGIMIKEVCYSIPTSGGNMPSH